MLEEQFIYQFCYRKGLPYFGPYLHAVPGYVSKNGCYFDLVHQLAAACPSRDLNILEVGSWAGASAITFAMALRRFAGNHGRVVCVDAWRPCLQGQYQNAPGGGACVYREMDEALGSGRIFDLFLHNTTCSGFQSSIVPVIGKAEAVLPLLGQEKFDLILIDGAHDYQRCRADILSAIPLLKEGGIICGDDLELQAHQVDASFTWANKERDCVYYAAADRDYHPGVTLAVAEVFGAVSTYDVVWAMQKSQGRWRAPSFTPMADRELIESALIKGSRLAYSDALAGAGVPNLTMQGAYQDNP